MTQASRPQTGTNTDYLDSGPYTADEWAEIFNSLFVGPNTAAQGPLSTYLNMLETTQAGTDILVDTGAGLVNGHALFNDSQLTFDLNANKPAANPRIDIVCMIENNTAAAVSDGTAANGWVFPTDLTDYNSLSSIPAYTARLAIVKGAEAGAPVAPALDTSTTLYMVPLAQYQVSVVPVISSLTDLRDWANSPLATKQRIDEQVLATAAATVTFSSIPQYYRHLEIQFMGGNDAAVGTLDYVECLLNGGGGAVYHWNMTYVGGNPVITTILGSAGAATANPRSFYMISDTNGVSQATLNIPNYTSSTIDKVIHSQFSYARLAAAFLNYSGRAAVFKDATAAITQIDLAVNGGAPNFSVGSIFTLYGIL